MDIKDKAKKLYEDLKKPDVATAIKLAGPILWKGLKYLINKVRERNNDRKESEAVTTPHTPVEAIVEAPAPTPVVPAEPKEITWYPSPNFSSRRDSKITVVVLHHTGPGGVKAALSWLTTKESGVSAHYVVDRDGKIYQLVKDTDKAWHCGVSEFKGVKDVNAFSLGIEIVGDGKEAFTKEQYDSVAFICNMAKTKYNIDNSSIVGHKDVATPLGRKTDPSPFDWALLFSLL